MENETLILPAKSWSNIITNYILNEVKITDDEKLRSYAEKLGGHYLKELEKRSPENIYINYLVKICNSLSPATHVSKISHSSSTASSFIDSRPFSTEKQILTTRSCKAIIDGAYDNAAFSGYIKFLLLTLNGKTLFEEIQNNRKNPLAKFSLDKKELDRWEKKIVSSIEKTLDSDALIKQIYFPVHDDYHLLQILKSSSLLQAIHLSYFDREVKKPLEKSNKQKTKNQYSEDTSIEFPNLAKLKTVQSQPQNVSLLNGSRSGGRINLFSAQPPTWNSQLKHPYGKSLFYGEYSYYSHTKNCIDILASYLVGYDLTNLDQRHPDKYQELGRLVNQLIDSLCNYAVKIHSLPKNWSRDSKLKLSHQHWLDPYREDAEFQSSRANSNFRSEIIHDFADWLNNQINRENRGINLGKEQQKLWIKMSSENFRIFNELSD